ECPQCIFPSFRIPGCTSFFLTSTRTWPVRPGGRSAGSAGLCCPVCLVAIEKEDASLKGVVPKDYARPSLDNADFRRPATLLDSTHFFAPLGRF
ncbi:MAG: hypothetical protein WBE26_20715, partial [Phycisphaerae bacterium]